MNLESPWLVWGFVVVSFVLAAVVLRLWPPAFSMAVFLAGLAALLDLREAIGKFGTENLIAVLALTIGLAHVAAAILAIVAIRRFPGARIRPTPG
ncbi:MAG TPA: hypothetical protein VFB13_14445, partial [Reyranella sp.]|nr:hypothetical protein [Reyranella sp.]